MVPLLPLHSAWACALQVMDVIEKMFTDIFNAIEGSYGVELAAIRHQFPFEPFVMKPMRFPYAEGVKVPSMFVHVCFRACW
jgi:hypothetical protein